MKSRAIVLLLVAGFAAPCLTTTAASAAPVPLRSDIASTDPSPRVFPQDDGSLQLHFQTNDQLPRRTDGKPIIPTTD